MSFLIDQEWSAQCKEKKQKKNLIFKESFRFSERAIFQNYNIEQELKKSNLQFSCCNLSKLKRQYRVMLRGLLFGKYDIIFRMQVDYQNQTITQKIDVMKEDQYLKISNIKQKLLSLKQLFKLKYSWHLQIKPVVTPCGKFQIQLPFLHFGNVLKFMTARRMKPKFSDYMLMRILTIISPIKHILKQIICLVQNQKSKQVFEIQKIKKESQERTKNQYQIRRYLARSSIDLLFDCTEGSALYQKIVNISIKQQDELGQMIFAIKNGRDLRISNADLYCYMQDKDRKINLYDYFNLNAKQRESIKIMLQFPLVKRSKNVNENKFIYNNIKIFQKEPESTKVYKLTEGGFGTISIAEIQYWYQNSLSDGENQVKVHSPVAFTLKSLLKKYMIIKQANCLPISLEKISHQKQIVSKLKCGSSIFLPKYYAVTARQHRFYNHLLIDYIQCGSLADLIQNSQINLSIHTVVHIMSQVAQGLRYLNQYKIVHLDLKPQNILLAKDLCVKIIDFGDAYNPQVCQNKDYRPGYTYPYGCPQVFDKTITQFTDKSDSFSIGMMLFQLIYGKYPVSTSQKQFIKDILNRQFYKRFFFIPEELQKYGQGYILPMLNQIIFKCLDPNVHMRPSLNWISVLMKKFLEEISQG